MNLIRRKNGGIPPLVSDLFGSSSLMGSDLFDIDSGIWPSKLGINVPSANLTET